jgi:all-trans-retinol 13,14-reductase
MSEAFDVVCIGTGISVLAYAASFLEAHPGARVLLLEKHRLLGGYATQFVRPRQHAAFDVSLHKLTGMGPNGNLRETLKRLGVFDSLEWVFPNSLFDARHPCADVLLPKGGEAVERLLKDRFPACAQGVQRVFEDIRSYGFDAYMQFRTLAGDYEPDLGRLRYAHSNLKTITVADAIAARVDHVLLRELLSLPCIYIGAFAEQTSYLYFLHVWYAALFGESAYVKGGSSALTAALVRRIESLGGEFRTRSEAVRILIDEKSMLAKAVLSETGTVLAGEVVVNAAPQYAMDALMDTALPGMASAREVMAEKRPAYSTTTLYLVLDAPPARFGLRAPETMLVAADTAGARRSRQSARLAPDDAGLAEAAYWAESSIEVTNYHALDPDGGHVVVINALDAVHHWPERKTEAYRAKKTRARDVLVARLLDAFPSVGGHVRYAEVSSPRTYERYTNNTDGSGYGALVPPGNRARTRSQRFPVDNVRFISQWASGGGYEATIGYGAMLGFLT